VIRRARLEDVPALVGLVRGLAGYEKAPDQVQLDDDRLAESLFCADPRVFAHVAEVDGEVVGMAIWFLNYSTWTGRHGIYLEDLYVEPHARRQGIGRSLLVELARVAVDAGYARVEWAVLDWNAPAISFYQAIGAIPLDEWTVHRLSGTALESLAAERASNE
jgi:GNAT superfamily N-acetyltransferase